MDWKFFIGDIAIPIVIFVIGLFTGRTIERKAVAKAKIKDNRNFVIQNSEIKK